MLELFTFGTIWFWILLSAAFIWILWFIENGDEPSGTGATVVFCAFMIISCFLGNRAAFMNAISYIKESPGIIISVFLAYLVFGVMVLCQVVSLPNVDKNQAY